MKRLKKGVSVAAFIVLLVCVYSFLLGNKVFEGEFENDAIGWYFLAKGLFCSVTLYLLASVLEMLESLKK